VVVVGGLRGNPRQRPVEDVARTWSPRGSLRSFATRGSDFVAAPPEVLGSDSAGSRSASRWRRSRSDGDGVAGAEYPLSSVKEVSSCSVFCYFCFGFFFCLGFFLFALIRIFLNVFKF